MRRTIVLALMAAFAAAALSALPAGAEAPSATNAKGSSSNPDVTALFPKAVKRVRAAKNGKLAKAVMLEAEGLPGGTEPVETAREIVNWRFVLDNQKTEGSKFSSAYVDWEAGEGFGKVVGVKEPFLEDWRMKDPPGTTLEQAVTHLRGAGYTDPFANVTLRRPILQTGKTPPLYIFGFDGNSFVAVNTKTGEVEPF
jgi:hypothetical protein